ncbi:lipid-binding protein [Pedobacter sp. KBW06]|uniref:START domain-containing protein n=1 Tax=Pedobacter sp. KBW06 TaxID=2153359 RepID=UPI000F5A9DC3|nr:START domain-containing protein [Pedobacter sp. KBW06]RQO69519.1 lipid-binding protein [Pedobacter sp. KBW06]
MYKVFLTTLLLIAKTVPVLAQNNWVPEVEKEGIKIYTAVFPNSRIKAVKAQCNVKATASQVVALLMDVESATDWVYHTKSCSLIKKVSPAELYYYSEISLPWPLQNRDFVAHLKVSQNTGTKVVTIDGPAVRGQVAEKKGIVRIQDSKGKWVISPAGPDYVNIEYTIHVDPGGTLPPWLINLFASEGPLKIIKNLKIQVQKPEYKNAVLTYIVN